MGDGKALQMGTSHELGQNFARAFDITFLDDQGEQRHAWTTSWGVSTRMVGGLIMCHGDDSGLRIPPRLAPIQVVVLVVRDDEAVIGAARSLAEQLAAVGVRVRLDDRTDTSFGRRVTDWELKGVPVRVEVGPRDLAAGEVTLVRRDDGSKTQVGVSAVAEHVAAALEAAQVALLAAATEWRDARTADVSTLDEAREAAQVGFARVPWSAIGADGEAELAASAVTVRCLQRPDGSLPEADDEPDLVALVARSY